MPAIYNQQPAAKKAVPAAKAVKAKQYLGVYDDSTCYGPDSIDNIIQAARDDNDLDVTDLTFYEVTKVKVKLNITVLGVE